MKIPAFFSMPWDMVVFLTITTVGFAFAVQKLKMPNQMGESFSTNRALASTDVPTVVNPNTKIIDLGCLDQRVGHERMLAAKGAVRIKGRFCQMSRKQMKQFGGVSVRNTSTGIDGTVIMQGFDNSFVTDAFDLTAKKTFIEVRWKTTDASTPQTYVAEIFEE